MARSEAENVTAWMCSTIGISSISAIFWEGTVSDFTRSHEKDNLPDEQSGQGNLGRFLAERDASERCELREKNGRPRQLQILSAPAEGGVRHLN